MAKNNFKVTTNSRQILADLSSSNQKLLISNIRDLTRERAEVLQEKMVQEFFEHPITDELLKGVESSNVSGTLGGIGNLFSFIGFPAGSDPIAPITEELTRKILIRVTPKTGSRFNIQLSFPDKERIFNKTPIPWSFGRSWIDGIEKGISGLGQYLVGNNYKGSRSGGGIQSSKTIRSVKFKNTKYLSAILKKYEKNLRRLR